MFLNIINTFFFGSFSPDFIFLFLNTIILFLKKKNKKIIFLKLFVLLLIYYFIHLFFLVFFYLNWKTIKILPFFFKLFILTLILIYSSFFFFFSTTISKSSNVLLFFKQDWGNLSNFFYLYILNVWIIITLNFNFLTNVINFTLVIELYSFCSYILFSSFLNNNLSLELTLKYFKINLIATFFILFSLILLFFHCGSLYFSDIYFYQIFTKMFDSLFINSIQIFFLTGFFLKLGLIPFHFWTPEVYKILPTHFFFFFFFLQKYMFFFILIKSSFFFFNNFIFWQNLLLILGILNLFVGNLYSFFEKNSIKTFFIFTSLSNFSYILILLSFFSYESYFIAFIFWSIYLGFNLCFFLLYLYNFYCLIIKYDNKKSILFLILNKKLFFSSFYFFSKKNKWFFSFIFFAFIGFPPITTFFSKILLLNYLILKKYYSIAFFIFVFNIISCYYYLSLSNQWIFFEKFINFNKKKIKFNLLKKKIKIFCFKTKLKQNIFIFDYFHVFLLFLTIFFSSSFLCFFFNFLFIYW